MVSRAPWRDWASPIGRGDPLAGRLYDTATRGIVAPAALVRRASAADFVLLGEKHDNPDHHRLQAWLLSTLAREGKRRAVVMEMLTGAQEQALDAKRALAPGDVPGFAEAVDWEGSGWPRFSLYRPLFEVAVQFDLPIYGGEIADADLALLRVRGIAGLPAEQRARLALEPPLPPDVTASLADEIRAGHCGMANDEMITAMLGIQRVRDASLADALLRADEHMPAVLIAGAGHVRRDAGVPVYLERRAPDKRALAVAFLEVGGLEEPPLAELAPQYDFVWYTPRIDDLDPCERFKEQLEKMKKGS